MMQEREWLPEPIYNYDKGQDCMHIFYSDINWFYCSGDEEYPKDYPDLYVIRDDSTNEIVGFTILDYSKYKNDLPKLYPQCFKNLDELPKSNAELGMSDTQ